MPLERPRAESTMLRRAEILNAALRCFDERGLVATTMEDIRAAADVSVGSLYHHFRSKEAIAAALYVSLIEAYQRAAEETLASESDPKAWIRSAIRHHIEWSAANPAASRFLLSHREPEVRRLSGDDVEEMNRGLESKIGVWLRNQAASGRLRAIPEDVFLSVLFGSAHAFVRRWSEGNTSISRAEAIEELSAAAWRAVRADDASE